MAFVLALLVVATLTVAACGGSDTTASSSPSATPAASPTIVPAAEPVSRWDVPGSASLAQTQAVTRRYATALSAETIPKAGLYTSASTWDIWSSEGHVQGAKQIEGVYRDAGSYIDWSKRNHLMFAPGVGVSEGMTTVYGTSSTPGLVLLAVGGDKITHEEVFLNEGDTGAVKYYGSAPGPSDTAQVAAKVGAAVGQAFATGDQGALQALVAPDILFRDITLPHGVRSWDALLAWWDRVPTVTLENKKPIAGPGWAVVRWTIRRDYPTGVELALPGATVIEVRDGKVVRMTVYYNSKLVDLQS